MVKIVGVKFKNTPKVYYFSPAKGAEYRENQTVIVETAKGVEYGTVVGAVSEVPEEKIVSPLKPILRTATEKDLKRIKENEEKIPEAMSFMRNAITENNLEMKLIGCEFSFDGKKVSFFFSAERFSVPDRAKLRKSNSVKEESAAGNVSVSHPVFNEKSFNSKRSVPSLATLAARKAPAVRTVLTSPSVSSRAFSIRISAPRALAWSVSWAAKSKPEMWAMTG